MTQEKKVVRCAIYTRKSTDEGLEQEFNSLDAQREAGEAYITSQRHEGWTLVRQEYADGGFSGGTLERPGLKQLLADIAAGKIDVVVVYKIDRLTRSLNDFASIIKVFEQHGATFVSVTQQFNTTTSMGRLTLNILLSFAQFERETISERTRDKYAASRRKGMWMGGAVPLGYDVKDRRLVINEAEAEQVRDIFDSYLRLGSCTTLARYLREKGSMNKRRAGKDGQLREARVINKGDIYRFLYNRVYIGEVTYKGQVYPGEHPPIINRETWDKVRAQMADNLQHPGGKRHGLQVPPGMLKGLVFTSEGHALTPSYSKKGNKLYRYYTSVGAIKNGFGTVSVSNIAAGQLEKVVIEQMRRMLHTPEVIAETCRKVHAQGNHTLSEGEISGIIGQLDTTWEQLFPAEQTRLVRLLVQKVIVSPDGVRLLLNADGVHGVAMEIAGGQAHAA